MLTKYFGDENVTLMATEVKYVNRLSESFTFTELIEILGGRQITDRNHDTMKSCCDYCSYSVRVDESRNRVEISCIAQR